MALELKFGIVWSFIFLFATTLKSRPLGGRDFFLFARVRNLKFTRNGIRASWVFHRQGESGMEQRLSITSRECRRRADEAQTLAAKTQDDWERELLQRITTQWDLLAAIRRAKTGGRKKSQPEARIGLSP